MGSLLFLAPPRRFAGADLAAVSGASVFMFAVDACSPRAAARGAAPSTEAPNRQRRPRPRPHWRCIQACSSNFLPRPLGAERGDRRERLAVQHEQIGHHARGWYGIIGKASGKKTAAFVVNKSFIEGGADRHRKSAAHLAVE